MTGVFAKVLAINVIPFWHFEIVGYYVRTYTVVMNEAGFMISFRGNRFGSLRTLSHIKYGSMIFMDLKRIRYLHIRIKKIA